MLKRLILALAEGAVPGLAVALALSKVGFGFDNALVAYLAAAAVGASTGLLAGKPFWARDAKTEASLKAVAGTVIAVIVMFGIRKWLGGVTVDLTAFGAGHGALGQVPAAALPAIGVALAVVLEFDDAFGADPTVPAQRSRVEMSSGNARAATGDDVSSEEGSESELERGRRTRRED